MKDDVIAMCQIQDGQEQCFCPTGYAGDGKTTVQVLFDAVNSMQIESLRQLKCNSLKSNLKGHWVQRCG